MSSLPNGFSLDISGVAGFLGGEASIAASTTAHMFYARSRWLGWYNQPGSYDIARHYGQLSPSGFFRALYPGLEFNQDPTSLFKYNGCPGPRFSGVHTGTVLQQTGHAARLFLRWCADMPHTFHSREPGHRVIIPLTVTVVHLTHVPEWTTRIQQKNRDRRSMLAILPTLASLAACALCGKLGDWFCFFMILLGIVASGVAARVLGSGQLLFIHPRPLVLAPPGDGLLEGEQELVVLKGAEGMVNTITRGSFSLQFASRPTYNDIGFCSLVLTIQFVAQLLVVPQGTLHGQILFIVSLACSWAYNSYLSTLDRDAFQRDILVTAVLKIHKHQLQKCELDTRPSAAVFVLLVLAPARTENLRRVVDHIVPNDTSVWNQWKLDVLGCIERDFSSETQQQFVFNFPAAPADWTQDASALLEALRGDAANAAEAYGLYVARAQPSRILCPIEPEPSFERPESSKKDAIV